MRKIIFYDKENLHDHGFNGIELLNEEDVVYIFYSEKVKSLLISSYLHIRRSKAKIVFLNTSTQGNNAMDFTMIFLLGRCVERNNKDDFVILSKDNGFKYVKKFCDENYKDEMLRISQYSSVKEMLQNESNKGWGQYEEKIKLVGSS